MVKKTRIIGVVSVKGGVGKTSVTSNLGAILAERFGKSVCLVDGNFSAPNLGMHLGIVDPEYAVQDVLIGKRHIFSTIYTFTKRLDLIPARNLGEKIQWKSFRNKLRPLVGEYSYVLIDASPSTEIHATIDAADALIVVLSPDYPTVSSTVNTIRKIERKKKVILGLVLNRVHRKRYELSVLEIEEILGYSVLQFLPEDKRMMKSLSRMRPFVLEFPRRCLTKKYLALAEDLIGKSVRKKRKFPWKLLP